MALRRELTTEVASVRGSSTTAREWLRCGGARVFLDGTQFATQVHDRRELPDREGPARNVLDLGRAPAVRLAQRGGAVGDDRSAA